MSGINAIDLVPVFVERGSGMSVDDIHRKYYGRFFDINASRNKGCGSIVERIEPENKIVYGPHPRSFYVGKGFIEWNKKLEYALVSKYKSKPEVFFGKFYNLICGPMPIVRVPRIKYTDGQEFCLCIKNVWRQIKPKYIMKQDKVVPRPSNIYSVLQDESDVYVDSDIECDDACDCELSAFVSNINNIKENIPLPKWDKSNQIFQQTPLISKPLYSPEYIKILRDKMRNKISLLRRIVMVNLQGIYDWIPLQVLEWNRKKDQDTIRMQSETVPAHGEGSQDIDKANNVSIETSAQSISEVVVNPTVDWIDYVSSDVVTTSDQLTNRWIVFDEFEWKTTNNGNILKRWVLPQALLTSDVNPKCDTPNFMLFNVHAYCVVDMTIKMLINSNKFQSGCLQLSWIYQHQCDSKSYMRESVVCLSQTRHVRAYAGSMNEVELRIPFKYSLSMLNCVPNGRVNDVLNLGKLFLGCISPLRVGTGGPTSAYLNFAVKFNSAKFTGMRAGDLPQMQMEMAGVVTTMAAMRLLDTAMADPNRDNPPLNAESPYVVPTASHSWCAGTGRVDIPKLLRLDTRGQTHHPIGAEPEDAFTVKNLVSKFGLLRIYDVQNTIARGSLIFDIPVEPFFGLNCYSTPYQGDIKKVYNLPPVSVISSCFMYWRGEIEFEVDVVASMFHTCKLLFAYIPLAKAKDGATMYQALKSPHVIVSIEGPKTFNIKVPYVSNQRWWPRSYTGNYVSVAADAPSRLYCFMLNQLIKVDTASDTISLVLYARGGPSFEVSVPVQPSLGLASNMIYYNTSDYIICEHDDQVGYDVWLGQQDSTAWSHVMISLYKQSAGKREMDTTFVPEVLYYKYDKDFAVGQRTPVTDKYRKIVIVQANDIVGWKFYNKDKGEFSFLYGVPIPEEVDKHMRVFFCKDRKSAFLLADWVQNRNSGIANLSSFEQYAYTVNFKKDGGLPESVMDWTSNWFYGDLTQNDIVRLKMSKIVGTAERDTKDLSEDDFVMMQGERDGDIAVSNQVLSMGRSLKSAGYGMLDFGESFNDLHDLCRRYQHYGRIRLTKSMLGDSDKCTFSFVANPTGLHWWALGDIKDVVEIQNRCRDGPIPLLLSGYRYFRGGLRFRLVFPAAKNVLIWVQHRPDRSSMGAFSTCENITTGESVMNHGYATEMQLGNLNSMVEVEVPFYQYDKYGLLQNPNFCGSAFMWQYGLGELVVGLKVSDEDKLAFTDKYCEIWYCIDDSFTPSVFYGFPQVFPLEFLPSDLNQKNEKVVVPKIEFQSPKTWFKKKVVKLTKEIADEVIDEVVEERFDAASDKVNDIISEVKNVFKLEGTEQASLLTNVITNLAHIANNRQPSTVAIGIVSIFISLGVISWDKMSEVADIVSKIMDLYLGKEAKEQTSSPRCDIKMQGPDDSLKELIASWIMVLYAGIKIFFDFKGSKTNDKFDPYKFLKAFDTSIRGANAIFVFIKSTFNCVKTVIDWLIRKFVPSYRLLKKLEVDSDIINKWICECIWLTDQVNYDKYYCEALYVDRIYAAYDFGTIIFKDLAKVTLKQNILNEINKLFKRLGEIRAELHNMGSAPHIRREPYGVYIFGEPGIGKSTLRADLSILMMESANIQIKSTDIFCVVNASQKHWNQCRQQPVLVLDDLWNIQTGDILYQQIDLIFQIFSPVVLCPPMADLVDKKMRYNPEIVFMCSNFSELKANGICAGAVNRRRNIVVEAVAWYPSEMPGMEIVAGCPHCKDSSIKFDKIPNKFLQDYHHMRFFIHQDKLEPRAVSRGNMLTYKELCQIICSDFNEFRDKAIDRFNTLVSKHIDYAKQDSQFQSDMTEENFFSVFKKHEEQKQRHLNDLKVEFLASLGGSLRQRFTNCFDDTCGIPEWLHGLRECEVRSCKYRRMCASSSTDSIVKDDSKDFDYTGKITGEYKELFANLKKKKDEMEEMQLAGVITSDLRALKLRQLISDIEKFQVKYKNHLRLVCNSSLEIAKQDLWDKLTEAMSPPDDIKGEMAGSTSEKSKKKDSKEPINYYGMEFPHGTDIEEMRRLYELEAAKRRREYILDSKFPVPINAKELLTTFKYWNDKCYESSYPVIPGDTSFDNALMLCLTNLRLFIKHIKYDQRPMLCKYAEDIEDEEHFKRFVVYVNAMAGAYTLISAKFKHFSSWSDCFIFCQIFLGLRCGHCVSPKEFIVINSKLVFNGACTTVECNMQNCLLKSYILAKDFHYRWLDDNYIYYAMYKEGNKSALPEFFLKENPKFEVVLTTFESIKKILQVSWKCFLKPGLARIYEMIIRFMPIISFVAVLLGVATGVKRMSDNKQQRRREHEAKIKVDAFLERTTVKGLVEQAGVYEDNYNAVMDEMFELYEGQDSYNKKVRDWDCSDSMKAQTEWITPQGNIYSNEVPKHMSKGAGNIKFQGSQQYSIMDNILARNLFYLCLYDRDTQLTKKFRCLGIRQNLCVGLLHYFETIDLLIAKDPDRYVVCFEYVSIKSKVVIPSDVIELDYKFICSNMKRAVRATCLKGDVDVYSNIVLFEMPKIVPDFKNIINFIAPRSVIGSAESDCKFIMGNVDAKVINVRYRNHRAGVGLIIPGFESEGSKYSGVHMESWWEYGVQKSGYCGSIIVAKNLEAPIVGIHVAGSDNTQRGYGEVIFREMFLDYISVNKVQFPYDKAEVPQLLALPSDIKLEGQFTVYGTVRPEDANFSPRISNIKPTLLHGVFPVETAPNPLRASQLSCKQDPLYLGVNKHAQIVKEFPKGLEDHVANYLGDMLINQVKPICDVKVLSDEIAVCGDKNIAEFQALAWNTSAGYPLRKYKKGSESGKKFLFNLEQHAEGYKLLGYHPELEKLLSIQRLIRKQGHKPFTVFTDNLKDTTILKTKLDIPGKTRIFSTSPVQYTIEFKKYFGVFMASYRRNRILNESGIGINVDCAEWTDVVHYLTQVGDKFVAGDYSNFGPSLKISFAYKLARNFVKWLKFYGFSDEDVAYCEIMIDELINRYHLCENIVYRPPAGSASGSPPTDIINTECNKGLMRIMWIIITGKPLVEFRNHVRMIAYGDDILMCVSDEYINVFNGITISKCFATFNIKFTDALKTGDLVAWRPLAECTFLKRGFVPLRTTLMSFYLAPIELSSVHNCLNWTNGKLPEPEATVVNLISVNSLLFGLGEETFNHYKSRLIEECNLRNVEYTVDAWRDLFFKNFGIIL